MGKNKSDYEKGRGQGHKDTSEHYEKPWTSGAGGGPTKPSGKSDDYNRGYKDGQEQRRRQDNGGFDGLQKNTGDEFRGHIPSAARVSGETFDQ